MTSPSICVFDGKRFSLGNCTFHYLTDRNYLQDKFKHKTTVHLNGHPVPHKYINNTDRFNQISDWAINIVEEANPDFVALEGYSMGSTIGRAFDIAENTMLLKYKMFLKGWKEPLIYAPTSVKKFATGKGNASKQSLLDTFKTENNVNLNDILGMKSQKPVNPVSDIIDSYYITSMLFEDAQNLAL